jgi:hypothetical protein
MRFLPIARPSCASRCVSSAALGETSYSLSIIQPVPGPAGPQGPQGPSGVSGYTVMTSASPTDSAESRIVTATCPAGKTVVGGGHLVLPVSAAVYRAISVPTSRPAPASNAWTAVGIEVPLNHTATWQLTAYAICASLAP